jgi:hypothetical protein
MKFSVNLMVMNHGAIKAHRAGFYVTADDAQAAIEKAKEVSAKQNPHGKFIEAESAYRIDGSSVGHSWVNPKYIVGANPTNAEIDQAFAEEAFKQSCK